jgi:predicted nucleic acid-binding protein
MLLVDTNYYVRAIRDAAFGERFRAWHAVSLAELVLSAVVLHELLVGATDTHARRRLEVAYAEPFRRRSRVLVPSLAVWERAADTDATLRKDGRYAALLDQRGFANDLLIALSARAIGATVLTENVTHFGILNEVTGVRYGPAPFA